jgi:hypothetical protein
VVPLLPKLRGHFAEFLNHSSLDRLGILYLTTCVGLGYGPCMNSLEAFLGSIGSLNSPQRVRIKSQPYMTGGFAYRSAYTLTPVQPLTGPATFLRHPIAWLLPDQVPRIHQPVPRRGSRGFRAVSITDSPWARIHGYGNINPLSIDYACRPRLRSRLTLGRLA